MFEMEYQVQMDKLITAFVLDHRFPSHTIYDIMVNYLRCDLPPNVINIAALCEISTYRIGCKIFQIVQVNFVWVISTIIKFL